jgi:regulator of sirC expression with transglutaminase-like and TPR domain
MTSPLAEFALLARLPDEVLDVEPLVVSIARMGDPKLELRAVAAELDRLAEQIADSIAPSAPPDRLAASLAAQIGGTLGFRGEPSDYRHAESSYLDRVLERRRGLPILLATVWSLLGRRLGVRIEGIAWPGHFLACVMVPGARIYVDPFGGGAAVEASTLLARLPPGVGRKVLDPAPTRAIGVRMLHNLKALHLDQEDPKRALEVVDRLLLLGGERAEEVRDRGLLLSALGRDGEARRDLERYLTLAPGAPDRARIEALVRR